MSSFQIVQGTTGYVNPAVAALTTGWSISNKYASHEVCNAGTMVSLTSLGLILGRQYTFTYTVDQYASGGVKLIAGTTNGTNRTANGTYTEALTVAGSAALSFYSDGALRISELKFYDTLTGLQTGTTISFNEGTNQWGPEYQYRAEQVVKFGDDLYALKNGQLWKMNDNPVRNNFFGEQFNSSIIFFANLNPSTVKQFFNIRVRSNRAWFAPNTGDINILPVEQRPAGMLSRLTKNRFKNYQGVYFADFLRNIVDPRYADFTEVQALFKAESLIGEFMEITLINDDTVEVRLMEVDIKSSPSFYTY